MDSSSLDIDSLISQTAALSWEDPSSQLESIPLEQGRSDILPLVGRVISQKTQNNQSVNAALTKSWFFATPFSFAVLGPNLFLFKFSKKEYVSRILKTVWNVNGFLLSIQVWSPTKTLGDLSLSVVPFWVQIHGLPLQNMTTKNAIAIGKGLGPVLMVEDNSGVEATFRSYLRILVSLDVSKPLKSGFSMSREDGSSTWVNLRYERLDIYCSDCGLIGHHQAVCLAPPEAKFPSRYTISLKVNVFSNLITTIPSSNQPANSENSPSSSRKYPTQPYSNSSLSKANQKNILTSSQNPLPSQKPAATELPHAQVSPSQLTTAAARSVTPIECTLNALSLFKKPTQLFSSPSTSLTNQTNPLTPSQVDPPHHITHPSYDSEPSSIEISNITAVSTKKTPHAPAKTSLLKKQTRKSPRTTKQPIPSPQDLSLPNTHISTINTPLQLPRKRSNTSDLAPPLKKGPGAANEILVSPDPSQTPIQEYKPGYFEKTPARAFFKAARKGKNKIGYVKLISGLDSERKGGLLKPPQQQ
jgi:hypothetical protein